VKEGEVIATVLTKKVSRTTPARTSTTIKKTRSAKTADSNDSIFWGGMLLAAVVALFIWMRFEQSRE
jgi:formate/nitrite transporter FocA (FNT family)